MFATTRLRNCGSTAWAALCGVLAAAGAVPALAHHSFAMFDMSKQVTISGTVRTLEWSNPHVWLWIDVMDDTGKVTSWGLEGAAPAEMARTGGWTKRSVKPGDKVTVSLAPLKDGRPGGSLGRVTLADGSAVGSAPIGPNGPVVPGGTGGTGGTGGKPPGT